MILSIFVSFVDITFIAILIGGITFRIFIIPKGNVLSSSNKLVKVLNNFCIFTIWILIAENILNLSIKTMLMSQTKLADSFNFIHVVLFNTHFGTIWIIKFSSLIALLLVLLFSKKKSETKLTSIVLIIFLLAITFGRSAVSHSSNYGDFTLREISDQIHLLAGSVWGGGLIVFFIFILPYFKKNLENNKNQIVLISKRFSNAASISLILIVLTAALNAWFEIGSVSSFLFTPYGRTALLKLLCLILLASLGALNHYSSIPILEQKIGIKSRDFFLSKTLSSVFKQKKDLSFEKAIKVFSNRIKFEVVFILIVLILTAVLVNQVPSINLKVEQKYMQVNQNSK